MADDRLSLVGECFITRAALLHFNETDTGQLDNHTDIRNLITRYRIIESIDSATLSVEIEIYDTVGLLESFPILGEERLAFALREEVTNIDIRLDLFLVAVSKAIPHPNGNGLSYTLTFLTKTSFSAKCRKVVAPFAKVASEVAKDVFEQTFDQIDREIMGDSLIDKVKQPIREIINGSNTTSQYEVFRLESDPTKTFTVQKSDVELRCVIPNLYADEALRFISDRAVNNSNSKSSSYNFFETKFGYHFVTNELLINLSANNNEGRKVKNMYYNNTYDIDPTKVVNQAEKIKQIEIINYIDTISDVQSGAYNGRITEIDIIYGRTIPIDFGYKESQEYFGGMSGKGKNKGEIHSEEFLNNIFIPENVVEVFRVKNYDSFNNVQLPGDQFFGEKLIRTNAYENRLNSTVLKCIIDGRLDLAVGDVINLEISELNSSDGVKNLSPKFSGKYFIKELVNMVEHGKLQTVFMVVKYGWEI